jgi:hypothetical protein
MDEIGNFMTQNNVSKTTQMKVRQFCYYQNTAGKGIQVNHEHTILSRMSPALKMEILLQKHSTRIKGVRYFEGAPDHFIVELASVLKPSVFGPKDVISTAGAKDAPFYLLEKGEVQLERTMVSGYPEITKRMVDHGWWNERQLAFDSPTISTARAISFADTLEADGIVIRKCIMAYPRGAQMLKKEIVRRQFRILVADGFMVKALQLHAVKMKADGEEGILLVQRNHSKRMLLLNNRSSGGESPSAAIFDADIGNKIMLDEIGQRIDASVSRVSAQIEQVANDLATLKSEMVRR